MIKPQLKTLGPRYGKLVPAIAAHLGAADGAEVVRNVSGGGVYAFEAGGQKVGLGQEDLLISTTQREGFAAQSEGELSVVLDLALDEALRFEGHMREFVSKVQNLRREVGLSVTDHIRIIYQTQENTLKRVLEEHAKDILADVLGDEMRTGEGEHVLDINDMPVRVTLEKV